MSPRTAAFLLLALLATAAVATPARAEPVVLVPHVVGMGVDEALDRLAALGFDAQVTWVAEGAPGRVTEQHPQVGARAELGSLVQVVACQRVRIDTIVPDVRGLPEAEAIAALEPVYALDVEEVETPPDQDGRVVRQSPLPGQTLPFRGSFRIAVGRARFSSELVSVPALEGLDLAEAEARLLEIGLFPIPVFRRAHQRPFTVLGQDRGPDQGAEPGAHVHLEVALPLAFPRKVRMPSLLGANEAEALGALRALGFAPRVQRAPSVFEEDTVVRQIPAAGDATFVGSDVQLIVAFPARRTHVPAQVLVPEMRGASLAEAWLRVRAAGLRLDIRRRLAPEQAPDGIVLQRPTAGVRVPLGAVIRVDLPAVAETPSLLGLPPEAALRRAEAAGLGVVFEGDPRNVPGARVVDQSPRPGTLVAAGSALRVVLRGRSLPVHDAVLMPDARGRTVPDARALLGGAGLEATITGPPFVDPAATEIVSQVPAPGTPLRPGERVRLVYRLRTAGPVGAVRVPDLVGLSAIGAQRALLDLGLIGQVSIVRGGGPPGVTGQSPAPGVLVPRGTEVRFTVRR